MIQFVQIFR